MADAHEPTVYEIWMRVHEARKLRKKRKPIK